MKTTPGAKVQGAHSSASDAACVDDKEIKWEPNGSKHFTHPSYDNSESAMTAISTSFLNEEHRWHHGFFINCVRTRSVKSLTFVITVVAFV